jgi:hypothetical protein
MSRRTSTLLAGAAALLACLAGSVAPAQARADHAAGQAYVVDSAEWHRLHPLLCHTAGDHTLR